MGESLEPTLSIFAGIVSSFRPVQPLNADIPTDLTESGIMTEASSVHPLNAEFPRVVTEFGMVTDVREVQFSNAEDPSDVTELPMVKVERSEQPLKTESPRVVTESGIVTDVIEVFSNAPLPSVMREAPNSTEVSKVHPPKACSPIVAMEPPKVKEANLAQSLNADPPIEVTPSEITTVAKVELLSCQGVYSHSDDP